jgi:hypothetical protein
VRHENTNKGFLLTTVGLAVLGWMGLSGRGEVLTAYYGFTRQRA